MIFDKLAYIWNPWPRKWKPRNKKGFPIFDYWQRKKDKEITAKVQQERFLKGENPNKRFVVQTESKLDIKGNTS
ncbi:MAG TPA: hypothetical protein VMW44_00855 [Candidatus Bathyarchaeia archaeon]|nr:hypothetical protein [Candidatus Bathyarchaeia archaeon]